MSANHLSLAPRRAQRLEKLCVDLVEITLAVMPREAESESDSGSGSGSGSDFGEVLLDEWDLRRVFNIPNLRFDPALSSLIPPDYAELAQPHSYCFPELGHSSTGFRPALLTRTCELLLRAWEQGLLSESRRIQVETAAILYWELVGGGADAATRAIFFGPERDEPR